jgi:hypothetical protein
MVGNCIRLKNARLRGRFEFLVPTVRLELTRLAPPPPQDGVSTNFTTSAHSLQERIISNEIYFAKLSRYFGISLAGPWLPAGFTGKTGTVCEAGAASMTLRDVVPR